MSRSPIVNRIKLTSYRLPADGLEAIDSDGCVSVPQGSGLGVEYDWDRLAKYREGEIVIE